PVKDWNTTDFNDTSWQTGEGLFGGKNAPNANTLWTTSDIWMRKEVVLKKEITQPVIKIIFDDDYEVYINGELVASEAGANDAYKYIKLDEEKSGLFKKGKNTIAVHCKNTGGNQHIDMGLGEIGKVKADVTFIVNTVPHKMAFDKTVLNAEAGQTIEIKLNNKDEMPHNLVVVKPGNLETFGGLVDEFLKNPDAEKMDYVPNSRNVLGNTEMLAPGENGSILIKLPSEPGTYPFVCTFPGHWRMMQGEIIVTAPKS